MATRSIRSLWMIVVTGMATMAAGGCAVVDSGPFGIFSGERKQYDLRAGEPVYTVEFYDQGSRVNLVVAPLHGQVTVDEALREARATDEFGRIKVTLLRGKHRMEVNYKNSKNSVEPLSNYHLHAGDRLIVQADPHSLVDDAFKAFDSPMAKMVGVP